MRHIFAGDYLMRSPRYRAANLAALTQAERKALKAIASGQILEVSLRELGKLKSLDLIQHGERGISLTPAGLAIVDLC